MLGSKFSNTQENNRFAASFMHVKLRKEGAEDYMKVGDII